MSDIVIPGVSRNSNLDTAKMIEDLMEVERIPLNRMKAEIDEYSAQQDAWRSIGRTLTSLRDTSRSLYGFDSPFRERNAESSSESILTATATRQATEGITDIEVVGIAGRDRFASNPVPRDYRIPAGTYTFRVGEDETGLRFSGGSLDAFAEQVNRRGAGDIRASIVPDTSSTRVLVLESLKEGASNTLTFADAALALALDTGIVATGGDRQLDPMAGETITLQPGNERALPLSVQFAVERGMKLSYETRVIEMEREEIVVPPTPPGPDILPPGSVSFGGITIRDETVPLTFPQKEVPVPPPVIEDNRILSVRSAAGSIALPEIPDASTFTKVELDARDLVSSITGFQLSNRNTHRIVEIRNLRVYDPAVRGDTVPLHPVDTARDAQLRYSGIDITRPSNEVDDLIPGVTLNLRRPGSETVSVEVTPAIDQVKDAIIEFVGYYNQVMRDINIYTRTDEEIIDEIEYFTDDERETYRERLGLFQGDSTLNQLKSRLQVTMMNPYPTSAGSALQLMAQIGISTNASGNGGGFDAGRLRGYIEINEDTLDNVLETQFSAVAELFGRDTNGDLIMDSGVGVAIDSFSAGYVQTGGVISSRTSSLDTRISRTEDQIDRYNVRLENYETQLRSDFGRMEGSLQAMQQNSRAFDNLGQQNQ